MRDVVVHRSGIEIDLQAPTGDGERLIREIMGRTRRPRCDEGELVCQRHGAPLYLREPMNAPIGCHWPHSGLAGEQHAVALMSIEHKIQAEYIARAAEREGLPVAMEKTLPTHVRPDLVVNGDTAFEVQRSHIAVREAKRRTTQAVRGGMKLSLWASDKPDTLRPAWLGHVPSVRIYAPEWKRLPSPGEAEVRTGLRDFYLVRHDQDPRCPRWPSPCGGWHLRHRPISQTLDRLSVGLAVGQYVAVRTGKQIWIASRADAERYNVPLWTVTPKATRQPREAEEAERITCRAPAPVESVPWVVPERPVIDLSRTPSAGRCQHWIGPEHRYCDSAGPTRRYITGWRCELHTPAMTGGA